MLKLRLVKESRIIQINGKMLIASSRAIVGRMNSQATLRSDKPRVYLAMRNRVSAGLGTTMRSLGASGRLTAVMAVLPGFGGLPGAESAGETSLEDIEFNATGLQPLCLAP